MHQISHEKQNSYSLIIFKTLLKLSKSHVSTCSSIVPLEKKVGECITGDEKKHKISYTNYIFVGDTMDSPFCLNLLFSRLSSKPIISQGTYCHAQAAIVCYNLQTYYIVAARILIQNMPSAHDNRLPFWQ